MKDIDDLIARNYALLEENNMLKEKLFQGDCKATDELHIEIDRLRAQLATARVALMHYERRGYALGIVARDALKELEKEITNEN